MSIWILVLLCVVQGLTEFLPVSSSGHLLFFEQVFGISENTMFLNLFLHVATLLAVVFVYRNVILNLIKKPFQIYTLKLLIATLFTVVLAFLFEILNLENYLTKMYSFGFLLTSILLLICHKFQKKAVAFCVEDVTYKNSILVGIVQGVAVVPGLSRSGSTISSLMLSGVEEQKASEFSFLLSIPIILGGFLLEFLQVSKSGLDISCLNIYSCVLAFIITFIVSLIALKLTIKLLKKQKFIIFSIYTFIMFVITFIINFIV